MVFSWIGDVVFFLRLVTREKRVDITAAMADAGGVVVTGESLIDATRAGLKAAVNHFFK